MNITRKLTLALALAVTTMGAMAQNQPTILVPDYEGAAVIQGLSNNGNYGVASMSPDEAGFSYTIGAVLYDLTGNRPVATDLTQRHSAAGASDVTNDGKLVVGSIDNLPAVCRNVNGTWTWETLPVPDRTIEVEVENFETGTVSFQKFKLNGGNVNAVTPDGKYGVGLCRSNEYELLEMAVMWDIPNKQIIEVNIPTVGGDGIEYNQTRFTQLSDDGRYILCWNAFSYAGSLIYIFDRQTNEPIYIDRVKNADGSFSPRQEGYAGIEVDGASKALTSDGRFLSGAIFGNDDTYLFSFEVPTRTLTVFNDGVHQDVMGWSITKDGMPLAATPAVNLYAEGLACYDNFLFPFSSLYESVYGIDIERTYGIDISGKPTQVSDDGRTIVFVSGQKSSYVLKMKEDLKDALSRVNLMADWSVSPARNTKMTSFSSVTFSFQNPVEVDPTKYNQVELRDSKGNLVANPLANGGLKTDNNKLTVSFRTRTLDANERYTLSVPEGVVWVAGRPHDVNKAMSVQYVGREDVPVRPVAISPKSGTTMANLDLNDNPIVVTFDVPVKINGTADDRPIAHVFVDGGDEAAAALAMDVDLNTNSLVIYPVSTLYLYKGATYVVEVPAGVVTDLSGKGPSEAFKITYEGGYVPQIGDDRYVFSSTCDNFDNFLFYEGDKGTPTQEYVNLGFANGEEYPWWCVRQDELSTNWAFASHSCYTDGRAANDWLVIRQLSIPDNLDTYLSFLGQSYKKGKTDRLQVYIHEDNSVYNQLTATLVSRILQNGTLVFDEVLSPGATEAGIDDEWTQYTVPLDDFKGKKVYICFVNRNHNQSMVMVDDIQVVKEVNSFITITGQTNMVKQQYATIKGIMTVVSDLAEYGSLDMTLKDGEGNFISNLSATFDTPLKAGDFYNFEFSNPLPLKEGVENPYTIEYNLDDDSMVHEGIIRNLSFQTVKRVVVEEYTGRDCQYCPLGILAMENLLERFPGQVIPVVLHAYNGDPKGANMMSYANAVFGDSPAAPSARINRSAYAVTPMNTDSKNKYHYTSAEIPGSETLLWQDVVAQELLEPALLDVDLQPEESSMPGYVNYTANVKSAITLADQNLRVLGVLMEDGILDTQKNALFSFEDEALGQFGKNGTLGRATFYYTFDNVARAYWGQSSNGTGRLLPSTISSGQEYPVDIELRIPSIDGLKAANLKMAVILIDENTGRVINAAVEGADITGIDDVIADEAVAAEPVSTEWYTLSGARVLEPDHGLYIQVVTYSDGSRKSFKVVK